ncbi:hypothetical protein [Nocardia sp. NPDC019395]|uniref:hypothetical protein n=1 Tax=Nocardia sp. NPDC019395 TaxID=3154686 RepID=UPI0033C01780
MHMAPGTPPGLLVLPEAVTITEVLCDLEWRRHIAMAHSNVDLLQFYELIARRLGQSREFGRRLAWSYHVDPIKGWVIDQRKRHRPTRHEYWRRVHSHRPYNPHYQTAILPAIHHFK